MNKRSYEIIDNHKHVLPHAPNHPSNNINRPANGRIKLIESKGSIVGKCRNPYPPLLPRNLSSFRSPNYRNSILFQGNCSILKTPTRIFRNGSPPVLISPRKKIEKPNSENEFNKKCQMRNQSVVYKRDYEKFTARYNKCTEDNNRINIDNKLIRRASILSSLIDKEENQRQCNSNKTLIKGKPNEHLKNTHNESVALALPDYDNYNSIVKFTQNIKRVYVVNNVIHNNNPPTSTISENINHDKFNPDIKKKKINKEDTTDSSPVMSKPINFKKYLSLNKNIIRKQISLKCKSPKMFNNINLSPKNEEQIMNENEAFKTIATISRGKKFDCESENNKFFIKSIKGTTESTFRSTDMNEVKNIEKILEINDNIEETNELPPKQNSSVVNIVGDKVNKGDVDFDYVYNALNVNKGENLWLIPKLIIKNRQFKFATKDVLLIDNFLY